MSTLLSLDLGITTGYAFLECPWDSPAHPGVITSGNLHILLLQDELKKLLLKYKPRWSVCEDPIIIRGELGDNLEEAKRIVRNVFYKQIEFVNPASWKPHPLAKTPLPGQLTPHQRDAIRLGIVYRAKLKSRA